MGRPIQNSLLSFNHDAAASENPKLMALRARYGWEGQGRFWTLNELIARADGCRIDLGRAVLKLGIAQKLGLSETDFDALVAFLSDPQQCGLLEQDGSEIWTKRTQEELQSVNEWRELERVRKNRHRDRVEKAREGVVTRNSIGQLPLSRGIPTEKGSFPPDSPGTKELSGEPLLSSPLLTSTSTSTSTSEGGLPDNSARTGSPPPPLSASPATQEKGLSTKVDTVKGDSPMMIELQEIYRKATKGAGELRLSDGEMSELLALFRKHDGPSVVAAYRLHQEKKPGKEFKYFLEDFPQYFAKAPRQPGPPLPRCDYCGADGAHTAMCNRPGNGNGLPAPDNFEDDFPEAAEV